MGGYVDAIPLLLAKGADVNAKDNSGKTALDYARDGKHQYVIKALGGR
jgi:ankyrin repeat protein